MEIQTIDPAELELYPFTGGISAPVLDADPTEEDDEDFEFDDWDDDESEDDDFDEYDDDLDEDDDFLDDDDDDDID
ncbi:MAG: hypothetical protein RLN60_05215 [Phycisphaerales bacterium]